MANEAEGIAAYREIDTAQIVVEWSPGAIDSARGARLAREMTAKLEANHPSRQGDYTQAPSGLVLSQGQNIAQLFPGRFTVLRHFTGAYRLDWERTSRYIDKHWVPLLKVHDEVGVLPTFVGLVVTLRVSTIGLEGFSPHRMCTRYVSVPGVDSPMDAELRVGERVSRDLLLNWTLQPFKTFEVRLEQGSRPEVVDEGLTVTLDVNTKAQLFFEDARPEMRPELLGEMIRVVGDGLSDRLSRVLSRTAE